MKTKYEIVKELITEKINSGVLKPGDKIMSENELMDLAQVSRHTVRKALNDLVTENVIETFKGKGSFVIDTINQVKSVSNGSSKLIAVVTAFINDTIFPDIINAVEEELAKENYSIMLFSTRNRVENERQIINKLSEYDLAGIIVEPTKSALPNPNVYLYHNLMNRGIPIIFMHGYYNNLNSNYVIVDDADGGYKACSYFIKNGHRNIGGIFKSDDIQGHRRYEGYIKCMFDNGLNINEDYIMWQSTEDEHAIFNNKQLLDDFIERLNGCTALICYNDEFAIDLVQELAVKNISIPEDISIIGFDNTKLGENYKVSITSINHPRKKLGKLIATELIKKIHGNKETVYRVLKVDLIEKNSVRDLSKILINK